MIMKSNPGIRKVSEKTLVDGNMLVLQTWISDVICPGRQLFQLALTRGGEGCTLTTQFPIRAEHFEESEVRDMYDGVNSVQDFEQLRREYSTYA